MKQRNHFGKKYYLLLDQSCPKKYLQIHPASSIPKMALNAMFETLKAIFLQIAIPKMIAWENVVGQLKSLQSFKLLETIQSKVPFEAGRSLATGS